MKINLKKATAAICLSISLLLSGPALAGQYTEHGYIKYVKSNLDGYCFLGISRTLSGQVFQNGIWYCGEIAGQNTLNTAKTAMVMQLEVAIILEGNGARFKPVEAVEIVSK